MLTRLYIDNFKCFVNFEYRPARQNLILGRNGSGKSSMLDALLSLRQFVIVGKTAEELFPLYQRTRWLGQSTQTFELEAIINHARYRYQLVIEPSGEPAVPMVGSETIYLDDDPIVKFTRSEVELFHNGNQELKYPLDPARSALLTSSGEATKLLRPFKNWLGNLYSFRLNPFLMDLRAEGENPYPNVNLSNIAAWYRHLLQTRQRENASFQRSLQGAIDDFSYLQFEPAGESVSLLVADFNRQNDTNLRLGINQLSDGQRCIICLYVILHFIVSQGGTVTIDEPENFISLAEIQPWLMKVSDAVEERKGQVLLISHHPELINQWAPNHGVQFVRDGAGSVRVEPFHGNPDSSLPPAELVARGWERG
jgi:predicted ATPase